MVVCSCCSCVFFIVADAIGGVSVVLRRLEEISQLILDDDMKQANVASTK